MVGALSDPNLAKEGVEQVLPRLIKYICFLCMGNATWIWLCDGDVGSHAQDLSHHLWLDSKVPSGAGNATKKKNWAGYRQHSRRIDINHRIAMGNGTMWKLVPQFTEHMAYGINNHVINLLAWPPVWGVLLELMTVKLGVHYTVGWWCIFSRASEPF